MIKPLGPADLQGYLDQWAIPAEILFLETPTPTVSDAAAALAVSEDQILKTIQFMVAGKAILAMTCGTARIDPRLIAKQFGVGRKKIKLANQEEVLRFGGYSVGTVPPLAHRQPLPCLLDTQVLNQAIVFAGGGAQNAMLRIAPTDIQKHARASVVHLVNTVEK